MCLISNRLKTNYFEIIPTLTADIWFDIDEKFPNKFKKKCFHYARINQSKWPSKITLSFSLGIPVVMIEYKASWIFNNIPPKECDNISTLLSQSKDMGEEMLILCNTSAVDVNITLRYETLAFTVKLFSISKA